MEIKKRLIMKIKIKSCHKCPFNDLGGFDGHEPRCKVSDIKWDYVEDVPKKTRHAHCPLNNENIKIVAK